MPVNCPPHVRTPAELLRRAALLEAEAKVSGDRVVAAALRLRARRLRAQAAGVSSKTRDDAADTVAEEEPAP